MIKALYVKVGQFDLIYILCEKSNLILPAWALLDFIFSLCAIPHNLKEVDHSDLCRLQETCIIDLMHNVGQHDLFSTVSEHFCSGIDQTMLQLQATTMKNIPTQAHYD